MTSDHLVTLKAVEQSGQRIAKGINFDLLIVKKIVFGQRIFAIYS